MEYMQMVILGIITICLLCVGAGAIMAFDWLADYDPQPTQQKSMDWDFAKCGQMRRAGWSESRIKTFMENTEGYYDKDWE